MGAIPVQTSTSCCDEWFAETGIRVGNVTVSNVKDAIREAISLADNQKNAEKNRQTIRDKASAQKVTAIAQTFYKI